MALAGKILTIIYGLGVFLFGLLLFGGALIARFLNPVYTGITMNQYQMIHAPFFFWQSIIFGFFCLISGIGTMLRHFSWVLIASLSTGVYFASKMLVGGKAELDIIATLVCFLPYLIFRILTHRKALQA